MADTFPLFRNGPHVQGLCYRFEKAGMVLEGEPIPWGADAVLIEALAYIPSAFASRSASDFPLQIDGGQPAYFPESLVPQPRGGLRLHYRLPTPRQTGTAELFYRHRALGEIALPVLTPAEFQRRLVIEAPTVSACIGEATVACQAVVSSQCQGLIAAALVRSTHFSLLPLLDLGMSVEVSGARGEQRVEFPVHVSSQHAAAKQVLVASALPRPRRLGDWRVAWRLGDRQIAEQPLRAISKPVFIRSLRVKATRFLVQTQANVSLVGSLPSRMADVRRAGPCFLVESRISGAAGLVPLRVLAQVQGAVQPPLLEERDFLIGDGPNPVVPGTLKADDLGQIDAFELHGPRGLLARLPLRIPVAAITSEGGFAAAEDFTWNESAEEELWQKIAGLGGTTG